ncbi:MAG TPA: MarC family protein [Gammaproteobacteria bacterium]|jgi:MarC family membrane protein|nr:MarC family protein [Gammaproteobacteria bacterium]
MTVFSAIFLLFLIMDPIGNVPLFLSTLKNVPIERRRKIIIRELLIALLVLLFFMFIGKYILQLLQIAQSSLGIAGGIMLFIIAIKMIFPGRGNLFYHSDDMEPLVVPLAVPLIAGPSAIAAVILMMAQEPSRWLEWMVALVVAWLIAGIILVSSETLGRRLGVRALLAIERLMGILLMLVSVDLILDGIKQTFNI